MILLLELLHDHFTDLGRIDLVFGSVVYIIFDLGDDLVGIYGALLRCFKHSCQKLCSVKKLLFAVLFDNEYLHRFKYFKGSDSLEPIKAIEAVMDGFTVLPMDEAAKIGDLFVTLTGCCDVLRREHFEVMKDGVLLANSGHFDVEINKKELLELSVEDFERKPNIHGYRMADGRILNLLAEGRLVNLAAGNGHPAEIMDMSFGIQAKGLEYLSKHGKSLDNKVYAVPAEIDSEVAQIKLAASGISIDHLSDEQKEYLSRVE